jgi:hypothetical protein
MKTKRVAVVPMSDRAELKHVPTEYLERASIVAIRMPFGKYLVVKNRYGCFPIEVSERVFGTLVASTVAKNETIVLVDAQGVRLNPAQRNATDPTKRVFTEVRKPKRERDRIMRKAGFKKARSPHFTDEDVHVMRHIEYSRGLLHGLLQGAQLNNEVLQGRYCWGKPDRVNGLMAGIKRIYEYVQAHCTNGVE